MKSNRWMIALAFVIVLALAVVACAPAPTPVPPTAAPPTAAPAATAAPQPTVAPTATKAPLKGDLNMLCILNEDPCVGMKKEFDAKFPGVNLNYVRLSAGDALTRARNEKANPQFDVMYGGPIDTYISAKKEVLLEAYKSPNLVNLIDPKLMLDTDPVPTWAGIYIGSLGFATNDNYLKANPNFKAPTSFDDLLKPEMKGLISIAHPAASGTAYTFMCSVLQIKGEKAGWEYLTKFSQNVSLWTRSGIGPIQSVGKGETQVGIVFSHDIVDGIQKGQPLKLTFPAEGTGWEVGAMGILKGAKNQETAKAWYDWLLEPATQELPQKYGAYQGPTAKGAKASKPELLQVKFMPYDFDYCGNNKKAFTDKFSNEIAAASLAK